MPLSSTGIEKSSFSVPPCLRGVSGGSALRALEHDALEACFQDRLVEVHEQTHADTGYSQVGEDLRLEYRLPMENALDLNDDSSLHNQVDLILAQHFTAILERDEVVALEPIP